MPVFSSEATTHSASHLSDLLLSDNCNACQSQPLGVTTNASFVIDLDCVQFEDLKADDLGVWISTGVKRVNFVITDGETRFEVGRSHGKEHYTLLRRYYVHGTCPTFHRLIASIKGGYMHAHVYNMFVS